MPPRHHTVQAFALCALGLKRLAAVIDPANVSSIRVANNIGMQYEKDVMLPGYSHPDHLYASVDRYNDLPDDFYRILQ
jgi:RimJ/RimL family protein N-acetyltransferase